MYHVEVVNGGGTGFNVTSNNYKFSVDTQGEGISPPDCLLAGLGTCIGVYIRKYAQGANLTLNKFSITVEADFSKDKPLRFSSINVSVKLEDAVLEEARKKVLLEFIKNCPVHNTLKVSPQVEIKIT